MPGDDDTGGSTSGGPLTTGVTVTPTDPSATGPVSSTSMTSVGATDDGSSSTTVGEETTGLDGSSDGGGVSSSGAAQECGNDMIEAPEVCDGEDLAGMACPDVGDFDGGTLACDGACAFDTTGCTLTPKGPTEVCETINLAIPDSGGGAVSSTVTVPDAGTVADVTVTVALTHTFIGDLTVDVQHGVSTVRVYDRDCGSESNMDLVFSDAGAAINCGASTSGAATLPAQALSTFDGAAAGGVWTFTFEDNAGLDTGTATEICVAVTF